MIAYQRAFIYHRILLHRKSNIVYPGLEIARDGTYLQSAFDIPGVIEAGWTSQSNITPRGASERDRTHGLTKTNMTLKALYERVRAHPDSWPFLEAVTDEQVIEIIIIMMITIHLFIYLFIIFYIFVGSWIFNSNCKSYRFKYNWIKIERSNKIK